MYVVLTGMPAISPSAGFGEVLRMSQSDAADFGKPFKHLSADALSFVRALLSSDPSRRPTAQEALHHPWLRDRETLSQSSRVPREATQQIRRPASPKRVSKVLPCHGCLPGITQSFVTLFDRLE